MENLNTPLLDVVDCPDDLRILKQEQLPQLAKEIRDFLLHSVSKTGGHLASGLGAVELTIALHYLFDTPDDRIIWDVGHQCYPHKILTGRKNKMSQLRQKEGLSGFIKPSESEFDHFGAGHSSTSISAALGMALAAESQGIQREIIAVIGDGGMTAGMAFEALNHAGSLDTDLLVVLNDNEMSISPNVGALSKYLSRIWSGSLYEQVREGGKKVLSQIPPAWELAKRAEEHFKGMMLPGTIFEEMGFHYYGPIDGHDLNTLLKILRNLKKIKGPRLLHIVTKKGKGYHPAENDACKFHGVSPFDLKSGDSFKQPSQQPSQQQSFTESFSDWCMAKGKQLETLHLITPAMREGSGLVAFSRHFPKRFHDVGIAEQHAVTLAAGMACDGLKPVVAIYSTFLQRAYDQLIHDVAIQNLDVVFAVDRAGIVGPDGATHSGSFDLSYCRCIPNLMIMTPANASDLHKMFNTACAYPGPALIRYPRDTTSRPELVDVTSTLPAGSSEIIIQGRRTALLIFGPFVEMAQTLAEEFELTVINMRFVKPLDSERLISLQQEHQFVVCIEDNAQLGGAGSAVLETINRLDLKLNCHCFGIEDSFPHQGKRDEILEQHHLDLNSIRDYLKTIG